MIGLTVPGEINTSTSVYFKFWQFKLRIAKGYGCQLESDRKDCKNIKVAMS